MIRLAWRIAVSAATFLVLAARLPRWILRDACQAAGVWRSHGLKPRGLWLPSLSASLVGVRRIEQVGPARPMPSS